MPTLPPSIPSFLTSLVRNTAALPFPNATKIAHSVVIRSGHGDSVFFGNALLHGYLRCGSVSSALWLFDEMPARDVVSWNSMVSGYVGLGCWDDSVGFFCSMRKAGFLPTLPSFVPVFVAVGEPGWLPVCRALHGELSKLGYSADCKAANAAMSSYVKCSCVGDARGVFDGMCGVDDVSFEILLRGCSQCGKWHDAFELFKFSCACGVCLSGFVAILVSCRSSMEGSSSSWFSC